MEKGRKGIWLNRWGEGDLVGGFSRNDIEKVEYMCGSMVKRVLGGVWGMVKRVWGGNKREELRDILKEGGEGAVVCVRMPNWLGDVVMALPVVRGIKERYGGMRVVLVGKKRLGEFLEVVGLGMEYVGLPEKGSGYYGRYVGEVANKVGRVDIYISLVGSLRGWIEGLLMGGGIKVGMLEGRDVNLVWDVGVRVSEGYKKGEEHQTRMYEGFLREAGLDIRADVSPMGKVVKREEELKGKVVVGLVVGSENMPEKRWPVENFRELIRELRREYGEGVYVRIFGGPGEKGITGEVARGFEEGWVEDTVGKVGLRESCEQMMGCDVIVAHDTGGMHLASLFGVRLVGLFGPTNWRVTGPVYSGRVRILEGEGGEMKGIKVGEVMKNIKELIRDEAVV